MRVAFSPSIGWLAALLIALAVPAPAKTLAPDPSYAAICERFAERMPRLHLLRLEMGDLVASRAWSNLLDTVDYEHLYFLQSDIDRFAKVEMQLDDQLKTGDTAFAFDVFEVFKERLSNRVDYVNQLLQTGFDWTQNESYVWQRKDAPFPASETEWNDLWRRKIKNDYLRLLIGREQAASNAVSSNAMAAVAGLTNAPLVEVAPPPTNAVGAAFVPPEASGTNAPVEPASTNAIAVSTNAPSIEQMILKRYQQAQTIIEDSDPEWVLQRYLTAFTLAYDPHSAYYTPSALEDFEIEMNLALFGIGALLSAEDGAAKIVRLIPGGPAARDTREKRLQTGDKIIGVAQGDAEPVDVLHWPLNKIVGLIRGEKGSRVVLTVIPASDASGTVTKKVDLVRDEVKLEDQAATGTVHVVLSPEGITNKLGVVRLPAFYGSMRVRSPEEPGFRSAVYDVIQILREQKEQGVSGVILDLRGNGGGALVEAIDMAGIFIRRGPTVQVKERFGTRPLDDEDPRVFYSGPLVVLVNHLSASASEIVTGALQDYGRAVIVGDSKTHGKGTVQSVLDLGRDKTMGALKVTTASYIRITGAATQLQGVTPDIVVPSPWDFMETGEEHLSYPIPWSMERPADFLPVADLSGVIPMLRERSEERRRRDPQFQAYARLLERIADMNETHALPLNQEERRSLAAAERELSDLQERLASESAQGAAESTDPSAAPVKDLVLSETLNILQDLVKVQPSANPASTADVPAAAPANMMSEWLRSTP